jgi:hypothetical protein
VTHSADHIVVTGRKPGTERCKQCSWTFPCRETTCGHLDCIEFRGELPHCHYCNKRVQGSPASMRSATSQLKELRNWDDNGTWTTWSIHGVTRAVHYSCRDKNASPADLFRWYGRDSLNTNHNDHKEVTL